MNQFMDDFSGYDDIEVELSNRDYHHILLPAYSVLSEILGLKNTTIG